MKTRNLIALTLYCTAAVLTWLLYINIEGVLSYESPVFDGHHYSVLYDYFKGTSEIKSVKSPFHTRIAVPFLASLLPTSQAADAFIWLNVFFTLTAVIALFYLWKKLDVNDLTIFFGFVWLLFHWSGIVRLNHSDPVCVDVPTYTIGALWYLALLNSDRRYWLPVIALVGTMAKEAMLAYCLATLIGGYVMHRYQLPSFNFTVIKKMLLLSCLVALGTELLVKHYFPPLNYTFKYNSMVVIFRAAYMYIKFPEKFITSGLALFAAFGPVVFAYLWGKRWLVLIKDPLIFLVSAALFLALFAGLDHTRLAFLGFPFVITLLMKYHYLLHKYEKTAIVLLSLPLLRLHKVMETDDLLERKKWFPESNVDMMSTVALLMYALVCLAVLYYLYRKTQTVQTAVLNKVA